MKVTLKEKIDFFQNKGLVPLVPVAELEGVDTEKATSFTKYLHYVSLYFWFSKGEIKTAYLVGIEKGRNYSFINMFAEAVYLVERFKQEGYGYWKKGKQVLEDCEAILQLFRDLITVNDRKTIEKIYFQYLWAIISELSMEYWWRQGRPAKTWRDDKGPLWRINPYI